VELSLPTARVRDGLPRFPRALYAAAFAAGVADTLLVFYLPLHVHRDLHESRLFVIGLVVALPQLGVFLSSNLWGALGDKWRRLKPLILIGIIGYTAMLAAMAAARSSTAVLWTALLGSLVYSAYKPGAWSFVSLRAREGTGLGLASLMRVQSFGWFCGNITCGTLLQHYGPKAMHAVLGGAAVVTGLVSVAIALRMPELPPAAFASRPEGAPEEGEAPPRGLWADLAALYESPMLLWIALIWFCTTAGRNLFFTFFSILYTDQMRGSVQMVSVASSCSALAGLLFFPLAGRWVDRYGPGRVLLLSVLGYACYFLANIFLSQPMLVAVLFIIPFYPAFSVGGTALVAATVKPGQRSGGMGVITGMDAVGALVGALLGGWAGDRYGIRITPVAATCFVALALLAAVAVLGRGKWARA
jgi:MFS transporter, DHA1 family, multidrug resistance protein